MPNAQNVMFYCFTKFYESGSHKLVLENKMKWTMNCRLFVLLIYMKNNCALLFFFCECKCHEREKCVLISIA